MDLLKMLQDEEAGLKEFAQQVNTELAFRQGKVAILKQLLEQEKERADGGHAEAEL